MRDASCIPLFSNREINYIINKYICIKIWKDVKR